MRQANVYLKDYLAGILTEDDEGYEFAYLPAYLVSQAFAQVQGGHPAVFSGCWAQGVLLAASEAAHGAVGIVNCLNGSRDGNPTHRKVRLCSGALPVVSMRWVMTRLPPR